MNQPLRETLKVDAKRAVLIGMLTPDQNTDRSHALDELTGLAETAGCEIVGEIVQTRDHPDPATYLGKGKIEEVRQLMEATKAELAIFDNNLSPSQGKNVEATINAIVIDRSELILDIFATHARTYEAKLQVELAQLLYMRPRLKRMWTHLERIEGGIGSGRGPGEKQLELDRRMLDKRVSELRRKLSRVEKRRERLVASRSDFFTVSLVGYTNAGKSTLMQALTGQDVYIADQLFATVDTKTRKWDIPNWGSILLSDTVGFVRDLPHHLVASFKSTLEEALQADLLLHVVDASNPEALQHIETVNKVLEEIGAGEKKSLLVLNKVDRLPGHDSALADANGQSHSESPDKTEYDIIRHMHRDAIGASAVTREGIAELRDAVIATLSQDFHAVEIRAPIGDGKLTSILSQMTEIEETEYTNTEAIYHCRLPQGTIERLAREHEIQVDYRDQVAASASQKLS